MPKVPEQFNIGNQSDIDIEKLLVIMQRMYFDLAVALNRKPDIVQRNVNGQTTDTFLSNGDININTSTNEVQILAAHPTQTSVTWVTIS